MTQAPQIYNPPTQGMPYTTQPQVNAVKIDIINPQAYGAGARSPTQPQNGYYYNYPQAPAYGMPANQYYSYPQSPAVPQYPQAPVQQPMPPAPQYQPTQVPVPPAIVDQQTVAPVAAPQVNQAPASEPPTAPTAPAAAPTPAVDYAGMSRSFSF